MVAVLLAASPALLTRILWFRKPVVLLWIGTDVYDFIHRKALHVHLKQLHGLPLFHGAVSPQLVKELRSIGINAELFPLTPPDLSVAVRDVPPRHQVIFYAPRGREAFYGSEVLVRCAQRFPEIPFIVVGGGTPKGAARLPNLQVRGKVSQSELAQLYSESTLLLRPTIHDGLPKMSLEALRYGLHVVGTVPIPGCIAIQSQDAAVAASEKILGDSPRLNSEAQAGLSYYEPAQWARHEYGVLTSLRMKQAG